jgi:hypothetical protein
MLVGMAGKRLAPTDPDRTQPRPAPIPWWDDLRWVALRRAWGGAQCA